MPHPKPQRPFFSSGPTVKHPGWTTESLKGALLGRSHRSPAGLERIRELLSLMREILEIPEDYVLAIIPGSTTGAMECALWSLLGKLPVDVFSCDVFGDGWVYDIVSQLKILEMHPKSRAYQAPFIGSLPDLSHANPHHDLVFVANGTTSGVLMPNISSWAPSKIKKNREDDVKRLVLCDATSLLFSAPLEWSLLDAVAFSWQKGLGGEGGSGMLALSKKALERLETYAPLWPVPRLFRLTKNQIVIKGIFEGETINTPSLLCIEDCLESLKWAQRIGGLSALCNRVQSNFSVFKTWVEQTPWIDFLAQDEKAISPVSVCLKIVDTSFKNLSTIEQWNFIQKIASLLESEKVAFDIRNHKFSAPSLRIWAGPTVETEDLKRLIPWIEWAYHKVS